MFRLRYASLNMTEMERLRLVIFYLQSMPYIIMYMCEGRRVKQGRREKVFIFFLHHNRLIIIKITVKEDFKTFFSVVLFGW